jgi:hypothetical protein
MTRAAFIGVTLVSAAALAAGAVVLHRKPLEGSLQIRGATIVDPPPAEPRDTHAAFLLQGDAARLLYEAMKVEPVEDECRADGTLRKSAGNLACLRLAGRRGYECDFAIDILRQTIEPGRVC